MAEKGKVIELNGEFATVSMTRKEACAKCRACIAGMTEKEMIIEAENECYANIGDWVDVEVSPDGFISALFVVYGLPLIGFLVGLIPSYFIFKTLFDIGSIGDFLSFVIGLACTGVVFLWIKKNQARWQQKKYRPRAVRVTDAPLPGAV